MAPPTVVVVFSRTYTDGQLAAAVAASRSWRGVLRELGLAATSSASIRTAQRRADHLGLDHRHFTGQRRWTDRQLAAAVAASRTWTEVAQTLGLAVGSSTTALKGHAARLELEASHLSAAHPHVRPDPPRPDVSRLPRAGSLLAAAWFELCGFDVSWPLEPCRYDLVAHRDTEFLRVQVKTTRLRVSDSWVVRIASSGHRPRLYDPDDIDCFFVVDGDLTHYLIPASVAGGRQALSLRSYQHYRVERDPAPPASSGQVPVSP